MSEWKETTYYTWRDMKDINGNPEQDPTQKAIAPIITQEDTIFDEYLRDEWNAKITDEFNIPITIR